MEEKYVTYQKFNTLVEVEVILDILKQNDIQYKLEDNRQLTPSVIFGESSEANIRLKLKQSDFEKADNLINAFIETTIGTIDEDYYLLSFSDEELLEVVNKRDEWSHYDYNVAKIELKKRGIEISEKLDKALKENRLNELKHEETGSGIWTSVGYISAFLGGFIGIAIGLSLWKSKKTLPSGDRVYVYNSNARLNGMYITILGLIMFITYMIVFLLNDINQ